MTDAPVHARYGAPTPLPPHAANGVIEGLLAHRSVRGFAPRALPPGTLETLVAAAQSAPTSSNMQSWSVVAVEDFSRRDRLARLANDQDFIRQAPLFLAWVADLSRHARLGERAGREMPALDYLEMFMVAAIDAALAAQNAVVAAESLGLGTCYVGALRHHPEDVARELALPAQAFAVFGLAVGWPAAGAEGAVKPRLPQTLVLHRERYAAPTDEAAKIGGYDAVLEDFSQANGMDRTAWTPRVLTRVGPVSGLSGRDRMRAALAALGFSLR